VTAQDVAYEAIDEGAVVSYDYAITEEVYTRFLAAFDDRSPVHVDDAYAAARGFESRVMHGAILNGFVSHFVGMRFPGRRSLLLSVDLRYGSPSHLGDELTLHAEVTQKVDAQRVVVLTLRFENRTRGSRAATGRVQVRMAEE
jgi:acyl dehydratase